MIQVSSFTRKTALLVTLVAFFFAGCSALETEPGDPVPFETLEQGLHSSIGEAANYVFTDEGSFASFWEALHEDQTPTPERPEVDFSQERVIAVTMGTQSSGGHMIEIRDVTEGQVSVRTVEPGQECITTQALTHPYHIVRVEGTTDTFAFSREHTVSDCS